MQTEVSIEVRRVTDKWMEHDREMERGAKQAACMERGVSAVSGRVYTQTGQIEFGGCF